MRDNVDIQLLNGFNKTENVIHLIFIGNILLTD